MPLNPVNVSDNSMTPGIAAEIFLPDQLIAGPFNLVTDQVTVITGQGVLPRGTVLGKITASGKYIKSATAAVDGSQTPVAILADTCDTTSADQLAGIYIAGEFNSTALTLGTGWTISTVAAALRSQSMFIKTTSAAMSNIDPT